jgi:PAT family beta-lactamase induction signal transducer AmpG
MASLPRVITGAIAGIVAPAVGWPEFFVITCVTAVPGLILLVILKRPLEDLAEREVSGAKS